MALPLNFNLHVIIVSLERRSFSSLKVRTALQTSLPTGIIKKLRYCVKSWGTFLQQHSDSISRWKSTIFRDWHRNSRAPSEITSHASICTFHFRAFISRPSFHFIHHSGYRMNGKAHRGNERRGFAKKLCITLTRIYFLSPLLSLSGRYSTRLPSTLEHFVRLYIIRHLILWKIISSLHDFLYNNRKVLPGFH